MHYKPGEEAGEEAAGGWGVGKVSCQEGSVRAVPDDRRRGAGVVQGQRVKPLL